METVVSSTPAPTTTPVPAAPATSAPGVESSSGKRPATFAEAFAQDAALHPEPAQTTPETAATGQVEPPAIESAIQPPSAENKGPIPFEVHKTALENARVKEREALSAEWKPYEAIRQVPPETMQSWFGVAKRMADDPVGFAMEFIDGLQSDARYAPQLRSHAGRLLAAGRQHSDPEPPGDVQIVDGAGNVTGLTYSDKQLAARDAWRERQLMAKVDERYAPLQADHDQRQKAEQDAKETHQAIESHADALVAEIQDIVESPDLYPEVHKAMAEHPDWSPRKCALYVRDERLTSPKLRAKADTDALDALKTKAAAATVNPSHAAIATTHRPASFHDPSLKW